MKQYFKGYRWKNGIPLGKGVIETNQIPNETSYKIAMDPYRRRITLEKYEKGQFCKIIYDSILLNFRHLNPTEQMAWEKTIVEETPEKIVSIIRNQDDQVLYFETCHFQEGFCRVCNISSSHGIFLSSHRLYYKTLNDPFNGVVLFDSDNYPVMLKIYERDEGSGNFTKIIEESWDVENHPLATSLGK